MLSPVMNANEIELPGQALLRRFDHPGPRYTSYPTADSFVEAFDVSTFAARLANRGDQAAPPPLSVYVHVPFCEKVCFYCACNKVVTRHHDRAAGYLEALEKEADLVCDVMTGPRQLDQLHLGGGTPTFLENAELERLMQMLTARFPLAENAECSIEVDPRSTPPDKVRTLAALGFNRISVGVQDFDPQVQKAVNRLQSFEMTRATIEQARGSGFKSVNLDLIYGLPKQTRESFSHTLDKVLELSPERIALYHYAHLPERFKPQRRIVAEELPSSEVKMNIMLDAIARLTAAGYRYIGMDHFAKTTDELARAQVLGRLHRNFQGYSTRSDCDLIGLGVSSISKVGPTYAQNVRELPEYYDRLRAGVLPVARGVLLDMDDLVRRAVIMALMCHLELSKESIESAYLIKFDEYFRRELADLHTFEEVGLVKVTPGWINVQPKGKLLIRAIAMVFDRYLRQDERLRRYSKIV
jgi:oxygen-independent coproporphyrinogen-3 oxidase